VRTNEQFQPLSTDNGVGNERSRYRQYRDGDLLLSLKTELADNKTLDSRSTSETSSQSTPLL
jgi:hypothetical protein